MLQERNLALDALWYGIVLNHFYTSNMYFQSAWQSALKGYGIYKELHKEDDLAEMLHKVILVCNQILVIMSWTFFILLRWTGIILYSLYHVR